MENCYWFQVLFLIRLAKGQPEVRGQQEVMAALQQDVTLACRTNSSGVGVENISVLKWSRTDLKSDGYVYFYRNQRSFESYQHPWFHGRVMLRDAGMKDGDASLILKNATLEDAGMYECHLLVRESRRSNSEVRQFINLTVIDEAETPDPVRDGYVQLEDADADEDVQNSSFVAAVAGGGVAGAFVAATVVFLITRKKRKKDNSTNKACPDDDLLIKKNTI